MSMSLAAPVAAPVWRLRLGAVRPWFVPVLALLVWQLAADTGWISRRTMPSPLGIAAAARELLLSGELLRHAAISCQRAALGFVIGGGLGLAVGVLNGVSTLASRLLESTLQMLRNIPHLAIIPMVILWFGIGEPAKVFLVAAGVFFPIYLNTFHGVRLVDAGLIEMGRVYRLTRWAMFWRVILPGAMPSILLGVRYGNWPAVLSGGQRQRVALARALVRHPGLLLLDEPLGALDALTRADMQRLIERIWQQARFTAVLVTHDVAEAVALSERVLVLRGGCLADPGWRRKPP